MNDETEAEDRLIRVMLAEQEANWEAQHTAYTERMKQKLAEERQQLAQDRLERQAEQLAVYRQQAIAAAVASKEIAPQFVEFITGTSHEEIDAAVDLAKAKTLEILAELAGQQQSEGPLAAYQAASNELQYAEEQARERGLPQGLTAEERQAAEDGSLSLRDYAALRSRLGIAGRDVGIFG